MTPLFRAKPALLSVLYVLAFALLGAYTVRVTLRSNFFAEYRMSTGVSDFHENVETTVGTVNQHQSSFMDAARMANVDARMLGAVVAARRVLYHRPLVDDAAEIVGIAQRIGVSQLSVHSTEAALRVLFAPSEEERLLYSSHDIPDGLALNSALQAYFKPYCACDAAHLRSLLRSDAAFNIATAALIVKQALTRYENENGVRVPYKIALAGRLFDEAITVRDGEIVAENVTQSAESGTITALLYSRSDMLP